MMYHSGSLHFWDMKNKHHKAFVTQRGAISPIVFAPSSTVQQVAVLFGEGEFGIWDLNQQTRISLNEKKEHRAMDICWASEQRVLVACKDGCLRIFDCKLNECHSSLHHRGEAKLMATPALVTNQSVELAPLKISKVSSMHCMLRQG